MANLTIYDPIRDMNLLMRDAFTNFALDGYFDTRWPAMQPSVLPLNMRDEDDAVVVEIAMPGFEEDDIDVRVEGKLLTIMAHREDKREERDGNRWVVREYSTGRVQRSVTLPASVKSERADAHLKNGMLTVRLPKGEESLIRKIAVKAKKLLPRSSK